jgi:hypothetical protein
MQFFYFDATIKAPIKFAVGYRYGETAGDVASD